MARGSCAIGIERAMPDGGEVQKKVIWVRVSGASRVAFRPQHALSCAEMKAHGHPVPLAEDMSVYFHGCACILFSRAD